MVVTYDPVGNPPQKPRKCPLSTEAVWYLTKTMAHNIEEKR